LNSIPPLTERLYHRSIWDILWSCLFTIFLCSWVSLHPNIPPKGEKREMKWLRRSELFAWSIIGPELVVVWALRQWISARKLADKYHGRGWTKTHGYFIQMGGFMLHDNNGAVGVLCSEHLERFLSIGVVDFPTITNEDIQAMAKSNGFLNFLVIIQTAWFIIQCITRKVQGLAITELELVSLSFVLIYSIVGLLWWNKPMNVRATVPIYLKHEVMNNDRAIQEEIKRRIYAIAFDGSRKCVVEAGHGKSILRDSKASATLLLYANKIVHKAGLTLSGLLYRWPRAGIIAIGLRITDFTSAGDVRSGELSVNSFYAYHPYTIGSQEHFALLWFPTVVAIAFGAIHCAGWNFFFPSFTEGITWRVSAAIITGVPAEHFLDGNNLAVSMANIIAICGALIFLPLFAIARIAIMVEAVISLRDLPTEALIAVSWTLVLPHI
ncbi:hypothetical protein CPB84DRAFT_1781839, partial [Gymnopilus junonius]